MPPSRPYWKGYLKLSLVSCPIALYTAISSAERVAFRQIDKKTGNRLRQQLVVAARRHRQGPAHLHAATTCISWIGWCWRACIAATGWRGVSSICRRTTHRVSSARGRPARSKSRRSKTSKRNSSSRRSSSRRSSARGSMAAARWCSASPRRPPAERREAKDPVNAQAALGGQPRRRPHRRLRPRRLGQL